jgi:ribonuclease J
MSGAGEDAFAAPPGTLLFLPLGGAGEIGMNLNLYGLDDQWLLVDLGVAFGDERTPGVDLLVPDPEFIARRRSQIVGLVLTHAHEDHLGAVPYLWRRLRCPVYATRFACGLLRAKLAEAGLLDEVELHEIAPGDELTLGPFAVSLIAAAHSIPEANFLAIRSQAGLVVHATDWKLDPAPLVGPLTDEAALTALGDEGVMALVCDSTNVFVPGTSGSEGALQGSLTSLIARFENRVAMTCFASNIARIRTIAAAAAANGRHVALIGRSLARYTAVARACGYLDDVPDFIDENEVGYLPRDKVLLITTGS